MATIIQKTHEPFLRAHRNFFVGLFVLIPVLLIPVFIVYALFQADYFEDTLKLHVQYDRSYGLTKGTVVTVSGLSAGYVENVTLTGTGAAHVTLSVLEKYSFLVKKNSKALLKQKNMVVGDWEIELTIGDSTFETVEDGDTLAPELPLKIDQVIAQALDMFTTISGILKDVDSGKGLVGQILRSDTMVTTVYAVIGDVRRLMQKAEGVMAEANRTLQTFTGLGETGGAVADSVMQILAGVQPLMAKIDILLSQANDITETLPPVIKQVDTDLKDVEILLKGLQEHPLLKKSIKKSQEKEPAQ